MSELKTIGNKLFKTELGSQRVELALVDDIKKMYAPLGGKFLSLESDLFEVKKRMLDLKKDFEQASTKIEQANKMAKDLGATEVLNMLNDFENATKQKIKDITTITSKI